MTDRIERLTPRDGVEGSIVQAISFADYLSARGTFEAWATDRYGRELWREVFKNTVTDVGAKHLLDNYLAGSGFTQTGPYLGLISSVGYGAGPVAADSITSHTGWAEAGNGTNYPLWTSPASNARATCSFSAASGTGTGSRSKALTAAAAFLIGPTGGTVKGAFIVLGSGAVSTNNNTSGILFSAGVFTPSGDKVMAQNETLNVQWSLAL